MDLKCAKISNHANNIMNPDNAIAVIQGQRGVACLACGVNLPKADSQSAPANIANIITESFMKRPALRQEAYDGIFRRANDRLLLDQSPQFPAQASTSAVFFLKNKFVMATAGDNVIFHFVNGVLQQVFTGDMGADPVNLGHVRYSAPKTSEELTFGKGENTFLICSRKFAQAFTENQIEEALLRATHTTQKGSKTISEVQCDRWLRALWDNIGGMNDADDYSAIAFTLPAKKKSAKTLVIVIVVALLLAAAIFFGLGFIKRANGGPNPPAPPSQNQDVDYNNAERPVGPNGETPPDPPKR